MRGPIAIRQRLRGKDRRESHERDVRRNEKDNHHSDECVVADPHHVDEAHRQVHERPQQQSNRSQDQRHPERTMVRVLKSRK